MDTGCRTAPCGLCVYVLATLKSLVNTSTVSFRKPRLDIKCGSLMLEAIRVNAGVSLLKEKAGRQADSRHSLPLFLPSG